MLTQDFIDISGRPRPNQVKGSAWSVLNTTCVASHWCSAVGRGSRQQQLLQSAFARSDFGTPSFSSGRSNSNRSSLDILCFAKFNGVAAVLMYMRPGCTCQLL